MNPYGIVLLAVVLNGCATSTPVATPGEFANATVDTIRTHARTVRDNVRAVRESLGLRERRGEGVVVTDAAAAQYAMRASPTPLEATPSSGDAHRTAKGHPARDAEVHEIRMDVTTAEMLTASGALQPRAAQALARMARMARESGGEFAVTIPRTRIDAASAILAAAPEATILSTDETDGFRLVVVPEEH